MLVRVNDNCWIKAKKINAVKLYQRGQAGVWEISVHTDDRAYIHAEHGDKDEALRDLTSLVFTINNK